MSITPIDSVSVAVDTFTDLKAVLENTGAAYTDILTVYLSADIQIEYGGINISRTRTEITLDGRDPNDPTGQTIHTITDYNDQSSDNAIGVRTSSTDDLSVMYRNVNWTGRNFYGICYVSSLTSFNNVSLIFTNINYTGPQLVYNRGGLTRIIDCDVRIEPGYSAAQEVGEVNRLELGGVTTLTHQMSASDSVFWVRPFSGTSPYFAVLPDSTVTINTTRDVFYCDAGYIPITIGANAVFDVTTARGMFRSSTMRAGTVLVDTDAVFNIRRTSASPAVPTFSCNGQFIAAEGATVYMEANHDSAATLLQFNSTDAALRLNNPRDFALYSSTGNCFGFNSATAIEFHNQQINYWTAPWPYEGAGTVHDIPQYSWRKADDTTLVDITASASSTSTTVSSHNLTADELAGKPLSLMQLHNVKVFSAGNLPITVDRIPYGLYPIHGTTLPFALVTAYLTPFSFEEAADENGYFSMNVGEVPEEMTVTGASNIPFLITTFAKMSEEPGEISLLDVPGEMGFRLEVVATSPVTLYGRQDADWTLTVSDDRDLSLPWYLYASITGPLTSVRNQSHTVPGALCYVDESDTVTELSDEPVLVYTGQGNGGQTLITPVSWDAAKGILLKNVPHPYFVGEEYRAPIVWTLSEEMFTR